MIYLASPYSGTEEQMQSRYEQALCATATLLANSIWTYSPIVHCHEIARRYTLPKDANFWQEYNALALNQCRILCVLRIEGYGASKGVNAEITLAEKLGKQLYAADMIAGRLFVYNCLRQLYVFPLIS